MWNDKGADRKAKDILKRKEKIKKEKKGKCWTGAKSSKKISYFKISEGKANLITKSHAYLSFSLSWKAKHWQNLPSFAHAQHPYCTWDIMELVLFSWRWTIFPRFRLCSLLDFHTVPILVFKTLYYVSPCTFSQSPYT